MLSYSELQSEEYLAKAIKKSHLATLSQSIQEMIDTIETQRHKIEQLESQMKEMQQSIDAKDAQLHSPEHKVALAIKDMMRAEAITQVQARTPSIVRSQVKKHLHVNVDTCSYYEDGGRRYDSDAQVEWY